MQVNFFCKIISLGSSGRLDSLTNNLNKIGLSYSIFQAFHGENCRDYNNVFKKLIFRILYKRDARAGEIGCALSHYYAIKEACIQECNYLLILEDDAIVDSNVILLRDKLLQKNFEMPLAFIIGHSKTSRSDLFIQRLKQPLTELIHIDEFLFGKCKNLNFFGTVGYILNKKAIQILSAREDLYYLADDWRLISNHGIDILHARTPLIYEDFKSHESTTGNALYSQHKITIKNLKYQIVQIIKARLKHAFNL